MTSNGRGVEEGPAQVEAMEGEVMVAERVKHLATTAGLICLALRFRAVFVTAERDVRSVFIVAMFLRLTRLTRDGIGQVSEDVVEPLR